MTNLLTLYTLFIVIDQVSTHAHLIEATVHGGVAEKPLDIVVDGTSHRLEIRSDIKPQEIALPFCRDNNILETDCNRIVEHVARLQVQYWPQVSGNPNEVDGPDREGPSGAEEVGLPKTGNQEPQRPPAVGMEAVRVDYSERVGPRLDVTMQQSGGRVDTLQRYKGESLEQAVTRFCSKHSLGKVFDDPGTSDCATAREAFGTLHGDSNSWGNDQKIISDRTKDRNPNKEREILPWPLQSYSWRDVLQATALVFILAIYCVQWNDEAREIIVPGEQREGADRRGRRQGV
mmetsp:Transcript_58785/g.118075  ORF Transcript_58785/g.118075 Transcript_58785/m.118075 type:complete len:289 (-) Transcript_58785:275-1141(-)